MDQTKFQNLSETSAYKTRQCVGSLEQDIAVSTHPLMGFSSINIQRFEIQEHVLRRCKRSQTYPDEVTEMAVCYWLDNE